MKQLTIDPWSSVRATYEPVPEGSARAGGADAAGRDADASKGFGSLADKLRGALESREK